MKEIIEWLMSIEKIAGNLYRDAAQHFLADNDFSRFLLQLAEDEGGHYRCMGKALERLRSAPGHAVPEFIIDEATKARVTAPFTACRGQIDAGALTREQIAACISDTEFSEWNDIFLYAINALKMNDPEFQRAASQIQRHKSVIEGFLRTVPGFEGVREQMHGLAPVWKDSILVVDDNDAVMTMLVAVAGRLGSVVSARNGREALDLVTGRFFDAIVTDIDMPVMNGMDFFREAVRIDAGIGERFLFFSGSIDPDQHAFLDEHRLRYLEKPAQITDLIEAIGRFLR